MVASARLRSHDLNGKEHFSVGWSLENSHEKIQFLAVGGLSEAQNRWMSETPSPTDDGSQWPICLLRKTYFVPFLYGLLSLPAQTHYTGVIKMWWPILFRETPIPQPIFNDIMSGFPKWLVICQTWAKNVVPGGNLRTILLSTSEL